MKGMRGPYSDRHRWCVDGPLKATGEIVADAGFKDLSWRFIING
jgi:hypothetical protein